MQPLNAKAFDGEGTKAWTREVFNRAYCSDGGPFEHILRRLGLGFSVLVYLPGSCMHAAAKFVKDGGGGASRWLEFGNHPGKGGHMEDVWQSPNDVIASLMNFLRGAERSRPNAIFKNLDRVFLDNNGGVTQTSGAQLALFSLIESTRGAATLGLADRDFGKLPASVEDAFAEKVSLGDVDVDRFPNLIPEELARLLPKDNRDGVTWLLASRLRFCDPVRAVRIMSAVARECQGIDATQMVTTVLRKVGEATRPVDFTDPEHAFPRKVEEIDGVAPWALDLLRSSIVAPYQRWVGRHGGTADASQQLLARLPPGLILHGPPGTGKTYLARWIAKSVGLPIRVIAGADVRDARFGATERNIARLFADARRAAPCVIVLDDADDLLVDRGIIGSGSTASADRAIVNTFLQQVDGFQGRVAGVLVILTTNRFRYLDEAVRSRLGLHVHVPYPLNRVQVIQLVESAARECALDLSAPGVKQKLIDRFLAPARRDGRDPGATTEAERARRQRNLFSPREIQQAMRLLQDYTAAQGAPENAYRVTEEDVGRVEGYYDKLAEAPQEGAAGDFR